MRISYLAFITLIYFVTALFNNVSAGPLVKLGEDCGELHGKFQNTPIKPTVYHPFIYSQTPHKEARYFEIKYIPNSQLLVINLLDQNHSVFDTRKWPNSICELGIKVRTVSLGISGGDWVTNYSGDITFEIGINENADLELMDKSIFVHTTFGFFPKRVESDAQYIYQRDEIPNEVGHDNK